jgi:hypothetical protein
VLEFEEVSFQLHQLFFGFFQIVPTLLGVIAGVFLTFVAARQKWRAAPIILWIGAAAITLPQFVPLFSLLLSEEAARHGATFRSNLRIIINLFVASELAWWPAVGFAFWLGQRTMTKLSAQRTSDVFE